MNKLFKKIIAVTLIATMVFTSHSVFLFAESLNPREESYDVSEGEGLAEELTTEESSEELKEELESYLEKSSDEESEEVEAGEVSEEETSEEETSEEETSEEETTEEETSEEETSEEETTEEETSEEETSGEEIVETEDNLELDNKDTLLGADSKNIIIKYDLDGGEWDANAATTDDYGNPCFAPNSTYEIDEEANGEEFAFAIPNPRRDSYIFKGWKIEGEQYLKYFIWNPNASTEEKFYYMTIVKSVPVSNSLDELKLTAEWEYRMDTIEYDLLDNNGNAVIVLNDELETDFSKTDYVGYFDKLKSQVISAASYLVDVNIIIDGVNVGKLVADFGGRFDRANYICNESFVYQLEREVRDIDVIYDLAGGSWIIEDGKEFTPNKIRAKSEIFELPGLDKVKKENFKFTGWVINGTDDIIDKLNPGVEVYTLVAVYDRTHSNIAYDLNGGKWLDSEKAVTNKGLTDTVSLPVASSVYKKGYKLDGWKVNGNGETLQALGETSDDVVLVAEWKEVDMRKKDFSSLDSEGRYDIWYKYSPVDKADIKSITFTNVVPSSYSSSWNINGDDIVGYLTSGNDLYVYAKEDVQITAYPVENSYFYTDGALFDGFTSLERITNLGLLDASETVILSKMFNDCENLREVDFEGFDTGNVTDMTDTFANTGFEELDLSNLDLRNVIMYQNAFKGCKNLRELYLNIASNDYYYNIWDMFLDCPNLIAVFVPDEFRGSESAYLFSYLSDEYNRSAKLNSSLEKKQRENINNDKDIQVLAEFKVGNDDNEGVLTAMSYAPLKTGKIEYNFSGFDVSFVKPDNVYREKLYGRKFYLPIAEEMIYDEGITFAGWYRDKELKDGPIDVLLTDECEDVELYAKWKFPKIKWYTLNGERELHLTTGNIPSEAYRQGEDYYADKKVVKNNVLPLTKAEKIVIDTKVNLNDDDLEVYAPFFSGFKRVKSIEGLTNFDLTNVTNLQGMFDGCSSLVSIDLTGLNTSNVTSIKEMFRNTSKLESVNFGNIDTSKVEDMSSLFAGSGIKNVDFGNIDTSSVTNMSYLFYNVQGLESVNMSNFNTKNVRDYAYMFEYCRTIKKIDISSFKFDYSVYDTYYLDNMFKDCTNLVTIIATDNFDLYRLYKTGFVVCRKMFYGCKNLAGEKGGVAGEAVESSYSIQIGHLDGKEYDEGYGFTSLPIAGVFSTKDTALVTFKYLGTTKADVRVGHTYGERIKLYVEPGTNASNYKYYLDENKTNPVPSYTTARDSNTIVYIVYTNPNVSNNINYKRSNSSGSSSGSSGGSSSGGSVAGPISNNPAETQQATEVNPLTELDPLMESEPLVSPNAITKQEDAKPASGVNFSISVDYTMWEKNDDGTWSLNVTIGNQSVNASNAFLTLTEVDSQTGIQTNSIYYFDDKGQMATGWVKDSIGNMYFFETANNQDIGKMTTGWKEISGGYYYFGSDGKMMTNGVTPDGYTVGANGEWII